jgi:hypothetical protein
MRADVSLDAMMSLEKQASHSLRKRTNLMGGKNDVNKMCSSHDLYENLCRVL